MIPVSLILYGGIALAGAGAVWYVQSIRSERDEAVLTATIAADGLKSCNAGVKARADATLASLAASRAAEAAAVTDRQQADKAAEAVGKGIGAGLSCSAAVARSREALGP